jgi:hypothetical protein
LSLHILHQRDLVLIDARHGIDLLRVGRLGWRLHLKLQQLLLKLNILHLHVVFKVDNPVSTGLHLLSGDVEQHMGVVSSRLGITKVTVNLL